MRPDDLPERLRERMPSPMPAATVGVGLPCTLDALEAEHIRRLLASASSLESAAVTLGIDPSTLYRKRKRFGL